MQWIIKVFQLVWAEMGHRQVSVLWSEIGVGYVLACYIK